MKLLQYVGPYKSGDKITTINDDSYAKKIKQIMIGIQIPFEYPMRYIEEDFYEKDIPLDEYKSSLDKTAISYLELEDNKIKTPHWLEKQYDFSQIKDIKKYYAPIDESDISITGIYYEMTYATDEKNKITGAENVGDAISFKLNENNLLEFYLGDWEKASPVQWTITANRELPENTIIDILYE